MGSVRWRGAVASARGSIGWGERSRKVNPSGLGSSPSISLSKNSSAPFRFPACPPAPATSSSLPTRKGKSDTAFHFTRTFSRTRRVFWVGASLVVSPATEMAPSYFDRLKYQKAETRLDAPPRGYRYSMTGALQVTYDTTLLVSSFFFSLSCQINPFAASSSLWQTGGRLAVRVQCVFIRQLTIPRFPLPLSVHHDDPNPIVTG